MSSAYRQTTVPVSRSQEAIRQMLIKFGARGVQFAEDFEDGRINIRFGKLYNGNIRTVSVTMIVPKPAPRRQRWNYRTSSYSGGKSEHDRKEQIVKATYRALHDWLKSQFVAIEFGLINFESLFLSHFEWILEDGQARTTGEIMIPLLNQTKLLPASLGQIGDVTIVDSLATD